MHSPFDNHPALADPGTPGLRPIPVLAFTLAAIGQALWPDRWTPARSSRSPDALGHSLDEAIADIAARREGTHGDVFGGRTGADLIGDAGLDELWSVEHDDDGDDLIVSFDDEVAHGASAAIDGLVEDLAVLRLDGVSEVYRGDRELVFLVPAGPEAVDAAAVRAAVDEHMTRRLSAHGPLRLD